MAGWSGPDAQGHAGEVTTRIGFAVIASGIAVLVLRVTGVLDSEAADIVSVLGIVLGALAVAIDGDSADPTGL